MAHSTQPPLDVMTLGTQWFGGSAERQRIEPRFERHADDGERPILRRSPASRADTRADSGGETPNRRNRLKELSGRYDARAISPRQMVSLSLDLYVGGFLTKDQYKELAFQPELLPSFDRTIGALTGEVADPDRPRDYTEIWRQRLEFEARHYADEPRVILRTRKILNLLKSI
jgi:hypothetical protein